MNIIHVAYLHKWTLVEVQLKWQFSMDILGSMYSVFICVGMVHGASFDTRNSGSALKCVTICVNVVSLAVSSHRLRTSSNSRDC